MGEDCCVLNVFTPDLEAMARRPVMVYLHGGSYTVGSGGEPILEGSQLARFGDVVVVTVNHRLNVFGYTSLGLLDERFPDAANAGQLDLIAALGWVRRNIAVFGGDPDNVTLFGQSGGGGKVMALMGMPAAKGLFHKAISMSGPWHDVPVSNARPYVDALLQALGIGPGDAERLQALPVEALLRARATALQTSRFDAARPVIDGRHLPAAVMSPSGLGVHASVPLLMGTTATEATYYFTRDLRNFDVTAAQLKARIGRQYGLDDGDVDAVVAAYREDLPHAKPVDVLIAFAGDMRIRAPMLRAVMPKADSGTAPVYLYHFGWKSAVEEGRWGSPHTADIPFAFLNVDRATSMTAGSPHAEAVARHLAGAFVAFARNGDPSTPSTPGWRPYRSADRQSMVIDTHCAAVEDLHRCSRQAASRYEGVDGPTLDAGPLFNYGD
ncbi:MAG: carboxylesterase family protein [Hydrogenophaga sp.]|nr:carboxylesterase family protein [Hydrogenophaga sp.]MDO9433970.1 carboxylesterase family protein [Hydrogenophaga sp.]